MRIDVFTIFPGLVDTFCAESLLGKARGTGLLDLRLHDPRDHTSDVHRTVDDAPFGGGAGMVMKAEPLFASVEAAQPPRPLLLLGPGGRRFDQAAAHELAELASGPSGGFSLLCGRYEGVDHRVREHLVDGELSVGDEHRGTVVAQHVLAVVSSRFARRGRRRGTVVIGAAPGDDHQIPVTIAADHLRAAGYEVVDFGVDTPPEAFAEAAAGASAPVAVVVGATMPDRLPAVRRVVRAVRAAAFAVPVLVGGAAIGSEQVARSLGADGWTGPDAPALVTSVEEAAAASPDDEDDAEG